MWPDRVSNLEPLVLESDALPTALQGPAQRTGLSLVQADIPWSNYFTSLSSFIDIAYKEMSPD